MSLSTTFPITRRVERTFYKDDDEAEINGIDLEEWGASVGIGIGPRVFLVDRKRMLRLCYYYRHFNGNDLSDLPFTDLITHRVRLKPGTRSYNKRYQKRWSPVKEAWLRKLILQGIEGGIYESTVSANGELSDWNAQAILIDKVKNPDPNDEPRLTFNYRNVHKNMPECALVLASKVHDYLSDPRYEYFLSADIKHGYFAIKTHPANRYVFAFYIDSINQL
jgi:hypothetical protein